MLFRNKETNEILDHHDIVEEITLSGLRSDYLLISMDRTKDACFKRRRRKPTTSVMDYVNKCNKATEKCLLLLNLQNVNKNIFCPYHENKQTSKTPSGKFFIKTNTFICFSTKCRKKASSIELLAHLEKTHGMHL